MRCGPKLALMMGLCGGGLVYVSDVNGRRYILTCADQWERHYAKRSVNDTALILTLLPVSRDTSHPC